MYDLSLFSLALNMCKKYDDKYLWKQGCYRHESSVYGLKMGIYMSKPAYMIYDFIS